MRKVEDTPEDWGSKRKDYEAHRGQVEPLAVP